MMTPLDRYSCEQVLHLLDDYLDRELTPHEIVRVEEHLDTCAECAAESQFESNLLAGLKEKMRHIEVPPSTLARLREVLRREAGE